METGKSVVLFDAYCNLCDGVVKFLRKNDHKKQFIFIPLQSLKGKELVQQFNVPENIDAIVLITSERIFTESDAALEIARNLPILSKAAAVLKYIPKPFRDKIYRFIAAKRYRWWGKKHACNLEQNQ
jgi:predicted DCC family thiol-disulfide oxidoreductase YuxK